MIPKKMAAQESGRNFIKDRKQFSTAYQDAERARSALYAIDAGCPRDQWVQVGMAAKAAGLSQDDFLDWSRNASNFADERETLSQWRSFTADGGIGPGTLFHLAKASGWLDPVASVQTLPSRSANQRNVAADLADAFNSWPEASAEHPYIRAKRGIPDRLKVVPESNAQTIRGHSISGWLAVPVRTLDGALQTVQYIPPPGIGAKMNASGMAFGDGLFVLGSMTENCTIYVCEGMGQAWACGRADFHAACAVSFGSGRMRAVAKLLRARYQAARIVIVPDRGKEKDAESIAREIAGVWVELPTDKPANYDANDFEAEHGTDALAETLRVAKAPPMRYQLQSADELLSAPPLRWMVQGVLPASGFAAVYGPSGSGKSFLVLDLCAAIAEGAAWFGRRVSVAPVIYVCLEGEGGLGKRAKAWEIHRHRNLPKRLRFVTQPLDLRSAEDLTDLCAAVLATAGRDGLLVIDTLNRAAPGTDENSSVDMGQIIEACKEAQRILGGVVLLVHHTGKDGTKGLRGHSSLYAALDAAIEVSRNDARREWSIAKSKDDADGERHAFALRVMEFGEDEHGDPVTSCVIEPDGSAKEIARVKLPQGGNQRIALDALAEPLRQSRDFGKGDAPPSHPCIEIEAAVTLVAERLTCEPKRRNERAREAITGLVTRGVYGAKDGWLWRI